MKKLIAILMAALMVASLAGCKSGSKSKNSASDESYVTGKGEMIVGITDYEPMDYKNESGEWTGFDAEFAQMFGKELGVNIKFVEIDWDNKFFELSSKSIDCIWNGMTITKEVTLNTSCSDPYVDNKQVVVMAKDKLDKYKDAESMKSLKFAAESGSAGEGAAKDAGFNVTGVSGQTDALMEVSSGSVDACIIDATMAQSMTGDGTSYAKLGAGISLTDEQYGVAFRKDSDLTAKFNTYLKKVKEDGSLKKLADKYKLVISE